MGAELLSILPSIRLVLEVIIASLVPVLLLLVMQRKLEKSRKEVDQKDSPLSSAGRFPRL